MENLLNTTASALLEKAEFGYKTLNRRVIFMRKLGGGEGEEKEYVFDPPTAGQDVVEHVLIVKRVILAPEADPTDLCLLEMETKTDLGKVEKFPMAYLNSNILQVSLDLTMLEAATLRLVKGKGPVVIIGEYGEDWREDEDDADLDDEECNEESEDLMSEEEGDENSMPIMKENGVVVPASVMDRKRKRVGLDDPDAKKPRAENGEGEHATTQE